MSELRKANTDYPYFITITVVGWIDVFHQSLGYLKTENSRLPMASDGYQIGLWPGYLVQENLEQKEIRSIGQRPKVY